MRNSKLPKQGLAAIASLALLIQSQPAWAGEEELGKSVIDNKVDMTGDTGRFERFPFRVSVAVRAGYDDNTFTTATDEDESAFINAGVAVSYEFGSPRTQLSLNAGAGFTYYLDRNPPDFNFFGFNNNNDDDTDDIDYNLYVGLNATHKATPRLTLGLRSYLTYQSEPDFSNNIGLNRRSGNFFYTSDKFSAAYLWAPRFSTVTSYTLGVISYDDESIGNSVDRFENTFGNEFRFLLIPTTSLIAEYRFQFIFYDNNESRDSTSHFFLAGVDHSFNSRFNLSVRAGGEFRDYEDHGDITRPYFEGSLIYALGKRTSLTWTNRYGIEEPDIPGSFRRDTFRTGLVVRHSFTPRITGNLAFYYQHNENAGFRSLFLVSPAFSEDIFDLSLSVRYAITRNLSAEAGYHFSDVESDIFLRTYARNRFWAGLTFAF